MANLKPGAVQIGTPEIDLQDDQSICQVKIPLTDNTGARGYLAVRLCGKDTTGEPFLEPLVDIDLCYPAEDGQDHEIVGLESLGLTRYGESQRKLAEDRDVHVHETRFGETPGQEEMIECSYCGERHADGDDCES